MNTPTITEHDEMTITEHNEMTITGNNEITIKEEYNKLINDNYSINDIMIYFYIKYSIKGKSKPRKKSVCDSEKRILF
jgi:hypothetical protein